MIERREEDRKYTNIELGFLPRSASWIEEMEKRSHRRIRDLVAHPAFQGLDVNENGCVRISIMAGSNALHLKGRIQMSETSYLQIGHIRCNARPVHTRPKCSAAKE